MHFLGTEEVLNVGPPPGTEDDNPKDSSYTVWECNLPCENSEILASIFAVGRINPKFKLLLFLIGVLV